MCVYIGLYSYACVYIYIYITLLKIKLAWVEKLFIPLSKYLFCDDIINVVMDEYVPKTRFQNINIYLYTRIASIYL